MCLQQREQHTSLHRLGAEGPRGTLLHGPRYRGLCHVHIKQREVWGVASAHSPSPEKPSRDQRICEAMNAMKPGADWILIINWILIIIIIRRSGNSTLKLWNRKGRFPPEINNIYISL